jgi:hypothetical protein
MFLNLSHWMEASFFYDVEGRWRKDFFFLTFAFALHCSFSHLSFAGLSNQSVVNMEECSPRTNIWVVDFDKYNKVFHKRRKMHQQSKWFGYNARRN